jgi:signal transduction histidine kinase
MITEQPADRTQVTEQELELALLRSTCRKNYHKILIIDGKSGHAKEWVKDSGNGRPVFIDIQNIDEESEVYFRKKITTDALDSVLKRTRLAWAKQQLEEKDSYEVFFEGSHPSGISQYYKAEIFYVDREKQLICYSSTNISSIVARNREQQELVKHSYEIGEAAQNAKDNFFANMSHEIRTPLNAIVGMAEIAKMDVNNPKKVMECMDILLSASQTLTNVVSNILDTSSLQSGTVKLVPCPADIRQLIVKVQKEFVEGYKKPNQVFQLETKIKHSKVMLDQARAFRVVMNLLANAANFSSDEGVIVLRVEELPGETPDKGFLKIEIEDHGKGISKEDLVHVYEPFFRDRDSAENYLSGTGLGLSVVKNIVDAKGASIDITSEPNVGTTVTVVNPVEFVEEKKKNNSETEKVLAGKRVLLVEDQPINMLVARRMLERFGAQVDTAEHGRFAVEQFMEHPENTYSLIFMDIQMPIMDGYEATKRIRESGRGDAKSVKIISMTANVLPEDIERARENRMNAHIGKPILTEELKQLIVEVMD